MKFKSHLYYEEKDQVTEAVKALKPLEGSKIVFYKNGVNQGDAFHDINKGAYYPGVAIFKSATVSVNFGPNFKCPPTDVTFRGVSNLSHLSFASYNRKHRLTDDLSRLNTCMIHCNCSERVRGLSQ